MTIEKPFKKSPDFEYIRKVILRQTTEGPVPIIEMMVDGSIMGSVTGMDYTIDQMTELTDLGNGFLGSNVVELGDLELTFVRGDKGSGHGFHRHEDLVEILVFLEGGCDFTVGETDLNIKGGSLLFIPPGVNHKVHYNEKSKVLRIKTPRPSD